jgi:phage-related protein
MGEFVREVFYYKRYYLDFFESPDYRVQKKFNWNLELIASVRYIPDRYFKYIAGTKGIYEIRVEVDNNIFRVFAFFDEGNLIIPTNGFTKKSQKTPRNEIDKARAIKKEYFDEKGH